jgi:hypothetical protein
MPPDYAFIDECLQWPIPAAGAPVPPLVVPHSAYADIPVLVVSGELDNMTSVADGEAAASHWPNARHVIIANSFHVNALPHARSECGAALVRTFLSTLALHDERCATRVPPVPLLTNFARAAEELDPARAVAGNQADARQLRQISAAWQTSADVLARARENGPGRLVGLRGGSFRVERFGKGYRLQLRAVRWTEDFEVSGRIDWPGGRDGLVRASLKLKDTAGAAGNLDLQWPSEDPRGVAVARGRIGGRLVQAVVPLS